MNESRFLRNTFTKTLRDQKRSYLFWAFGVVAMTFLMGAFWPSIAASGEQFNDLVDSYPPAIAAFFGDLADFTTPAGYLTSEWFAFTGVVLLLVYAIGKGADLLAGDEERGMLDVLLTHPVARRRAYLEMASTLVVGTLGLALISWLGLLAGAVVFGMDIGFGRLLAGSLMLGLLAVVFGSVAFGLGGLGLSRGQAIAVSAAYATADFFVNALAKSNANTAWLRKLTMNYHYLEGEPLKGGFPWLHAAILLGVCFVLLAAGWWRFGTRDIGT